MKTRNNTDHGSIIFVDVSGSMEDDDERITSTVNDIIKNTEDNDGVVSLYSSNHNLRQHFFNNRNTFCKNLEYGGLSSVYDNFMRCVSDHLDYNSDTTYEMYVLSDLKDNNSHNSERDFFSFVEKVETYWKIHFIKYV
jgi:hypothetical protein